MSKQELQDQIDALTARVMALETAAALMAVADSMSNVSVAVNKIAAAAKKPAKKAGEADA